MNDPIVDEIRRIREEHAARFNYDLWAIYQDIQERQARSGLTYVSFSDQPVVVESSVNSEPFDQNVPPAPEVQAV
jgi:hypothetical protein